ncbi:MAG: hypothetical protein ACFCU5_02125 [Pleurocapsa sp.]
MTKLPDREQQNFVNFLRDNRPLPPDCQGNLEPKLMNSIGEQPKRHHKYGSNLIWTIPGAIATGVLFTSVGLSFKTPQVTIETSELDKLDKFVVNSWNDTIDHGSFVVWNEEDTHLIFSDFQQPQTQTTLSLSAK